MINGLNSDFYDLNGLRDMNIDYLNSSKGEYFEDIKDNIQNQLDSLSGSIYLLDNIMNISLYNQYLSLSGSIYSNLIYLNNELSILENIINSEIENRMTLSGIVYYNNQENNITDTYLYNLNNTLSGIVYYNNQENNKTDTYLYNLYNTLSGIVFNNNQNTNIINNNLYNLNDTLSGIVYYNNQETNKADTYLYNYCTSISGVVDYMKEEITTNTLNIIGSNYNNIYSDLSYNLLLKSNQESIILNSSNSIFSLPNHKFNNGIGLYGDNGIYLSSYNTGIGINDLYELRSVYTYTNARGGIGPYLSYLNTETANQWGSINSLQSSMTSQESHSTGNSIGLGLLGIGAVGGFVGTAVGFGVLQAQIAALNAVVSALSARVQTIYLRLVANEENINSLIYRTRFLYGNTFNSNLNVPYMTFLGNNSIAVNQTHIVGDCTCYNDLEVKGDLKVSGMIRDNFGLTIQWNIPS